MLSDNNGSIFFPDNNTVQIIIINSNSIMIRVTPRSNIFCGNYLKYVGTRFLHFLVSFDFFFHTNFIIHIFFFFFWLKSSHTRVWFSKIVTNPKKNKLALSYYLPPYKYDIFDDKICNPICVMNRCNILYCTVYSIRNLYTNSYN